jgi:uncharacterized protein (TIGR03437 family)
VLHILSGNNQSGPPGPLSTPLTARVEDAAGNPIPNVAVIWQPLTPQAVSLTNAVFTSDASGVVSATAILSAVGPAQVQLKIASLPVQTVFQLQGALTLTGIRVASGIEQVAAPGAFFAQPIVLQVSAAEGAAAGMPVQIVSSGPPVSIPNGGQAVTDASGRVTLFIQAGSTTGTTLLTATAGSFSVSFFLTIQGTPLPPIPLSFFNAASGQPGAISPTEVLSIYAPGLAPGLQGCAATASQIVGPLPLSLANVRVQFASGGYSSFAPVFSVCNLGAGQEYVVVETPADLPLVDTAVTVQVAGAALAGSTIATAAAGPGIFETVMSDGAGRAVLQRLDGSYVSLESPAKPGERLRAFATGLGRPVTASGILINTNQAGIIGDDASPPNPVALRIAGLDVPVVSAIYSTDTVGVYVITFDLPADAPSGPDSDFGVATVVGGQNLFGKLSKLPIQ